MRKHLFHLLSALVALMLTTIACGGGGDKSVGVTSVTMSTGALTLSVGQPPQTLTATVLPQNATNKGVTWSSSNTGAATVANGTVTAIAPGSAVITVKTDDGGKTATCNVTVIIPVASISLNETAIELMQGRQFTLTETVTPPDATNKDVIWNSDHPEIAAVNNGFVTAMAVGQTVITATSVQDAAKKGQCAVNVTPLVIPVTGITLNKNNLTLDINSNDTERLEATVLPAEATNPDIAWESDDPAVASVTQEGVVTAVTPGTATITAASAAYPGVAAECVVAVIKSADPGVYVAGWVRENNLNQSYLWKDSEPQRLSSAGTDSTLYSSVFASDKVYAVGFERSASTNWNQIPYLYVDGEAQPLALPAGRTSAEPRSVFVADGVQYVAGNSNYRAVLWTDNAPVLLSGDMDGEARSIYVYEGKTYVAGASGYPYIATLWINGERKLLQPLEGSLTEANSVFVSGGNVYVVGYERDNSAWQFYATLWINDTRYRLPHSDSTVRASSVYVSGGKAYVAGYCTYPAAYSRTAVLWEVALTADGGEIDGTPQITYFSPANVYSEAYSVFASGGYVYVAGQTGSSPNEAATIWEVAENGVYTLKGLSSDRSSASSVFVK